MIYLDNNTTTRVADVNHHVPPARRAHTGHTAARGEILMIMRALLLLLALAFTAAPARSDGTPIAPAPIGPTADFPSASSTAFAAGRFLTVWRHDVAERGAHLYGALQDANGRRISPTAFPIILDADPFLIRVVGIGDRFAVFWNGTNYRRMFLTYVDRDGRPDATIELDLPAGVFLNAAAWNGTHFALAFRQPIADRSGVGKGIIAAAIIDDRGQTLQRFSLMSVDAALAHVAVDDESFIVMVSAHTGLSAHRLHSDGRVIHTPVDTMRNAVMTAVRVSGEGLRLIWTPWTPQTGSPQLSTAVLRADGSVTDRTVFTTNAQSTITALSAVVVSDGVRVFISSRADYAPTEVAVVSLDRTGRPVAGAVTLATASDIAAIHGDVVLARVQLADDRSFQVIMLVIRGLSIVSREVLSITPARQLQPLLTSLGTAYIAVWMELSGATFTTKSAVLDATGSRTTTVRQLRGAPVALTSSGFDALLLSTDAGELIATQIGRDGSVLRETAIATPEWSSPPAVVWAGSHYLIGWLDRAGMSIVLLTADGIASTVRHITLDSPHAAPPGTVRAWTDAHFAFDGTHVLLAFRQVNVPPWPVFEPQDAIALAVRLDRYGTVMDAMPTVVDADDPQALSLATSGIEFVLVARNAESAVRATTISTQPTIRVDASAIIFEAPRDVGAAVSWSGRDYAVVISHQAFKSRIAVKYLARDLSPTRTATTTETPSWIRSPVIAATFGGDVIVAASEAQERATVAVTYSSDHMRPLGLPPLPPQRVQTLTDPARYQVTVTWEAPPGPITWEGFAIQIRPPVGGGYASLVEASARSATVSAATRQRITVRTFNEAGLSPAEPEIPRRRSVAF